MLHPAPICDPPLVIPHNSDKKTTKNGDFIGQEITIECREGFEFTDTPAVFTAIEDNTVSLGDMQDKVEDFTFILLAPIVYEDGDWSDWDPWSPCTTTCGDGSRRRWRACSVDGACLGDYLEKKNCNLRDCRECHQSNIR